MELTLFLILIFFVLSASFSSLETALFALTPVERHRLRAGSGLSHWIEEVLKKPRELLTTVLFGNEMVNVGISILAGGLAYEFFQGVDVRIVFLSTIAVTTFVLLVFGEIIPKNVAIRNRVVVCQALILPFRFFSWLVSPFRVSLTWVADRLVALFGAEPQKRMIVEEEFQTFLELGRKEGTLAELERTLIQNAIAFSDIPVSRIMTPRDKIVAIPETFSFKQIVAILLENRFSRVPVHRGSLDHIVGILYAKELIDLKLSNQEEGLPSIIKPHAELGPDQKLSQVFEMLRERRIHMGIVRDAGGNVVGLVTLDDLLGRLFP